MTPEESELWQRISTFSFDDPAAARPFSARVAHENSWSAEFTQRAIEEYRRFAFLAVVSAEPVSPSPTVDEVWHEHLLYTRSYWDEFCAKTLGKRLHHEPSRGGASEGAKFAAWYSRTLSDYRRYFGEPPPDIWPAAQRAQKQKGKTAVLTLIQRFLPTSSLAVIASCACVAAAFSVFGCTGVGRSGFNPIDFNGPDFLAFWIPLTAIFFLVAVVLRWRARRVIAQPRQLRDPVDVALLAGGLERVAGSVLARLYRRGLITVEGDKLKASGHLPADATPCERIGFEVCAGGISAMSQLVMPLKPHVQSNVDALMDAKLLVDDATARAIRNMTLGCMAIPLLLGITKLIVGINRDRPVGFLIIGLIAAGFCTYFAIRRPLRTSAGDTALDALKDENEDLTPASLDITRLPDPTSAALAVALFGTAVLPGMAMSSIRPIFGGIDADGSSSGSGCGSGCGGGGGGSGCGGCGGH